MSKILDNLATAIDVWQLSPLALDSKVMRARFFDCLSPKEQERNGRFSDEGGRHLDLATRTLSRLVLPEYAGMGITPHELRFGTNEFGKPFIEYPAAAQSLMFNLSHVSDLIVLAVSRDRPIGVDVMRLDTRVELDALNHHFFSNDERDRLWDVQANDLNEAALRIWIAKEAVVKAIGTGLSNPPQNLTIKMNGETASCGDWRVIFRRVKKNASRCGGDLRLLCRRSMAR